MTPTATVGFVDAVQPLGRLNPPGDYDELVTDSVTDALPGVVGWINDAVAWVTRRFGHEINVVQWLTGTVGGDWGSLLSLADAWNSLAWASTDIAANLSTGVLEHDPHGTVTRRMRSRRTWSSGTTLSCRTPVCAERSGIRCATSRPWPRSSCRPRST